MDSNNKTPPSSQKGMIGCVSMGAIMGLFLWLISGNFIFMVIGLSIGTGSGAAISEAQNKE